MILAITGAVLLPAFMIIKEIPEIYESRAVVVVADRAEGGVVSSGFIASISEQLTSRAALAPMIEKYDLYRPVVEGGGMDLAVAQMRKAITVETTQRRENLESLAIGYRYSDPEIARAVLADLVSKFDTANEELRRQAQAELGSLNAEIGTLDSQLDGLDRVRASSARAVEAARREFDAMQETRSRREAASSSIETLEARRQALTAQVAGLQQQIKDQEELVAAVATSAPAATSGAAGSLMVRRAELQAKLNEFAGVYTDKNPKVKAARAQLAEVERQIEKVEKGEAPAATTANTAEAAELRGLRRDLARLETELDITSSELSRRQSSLPQVPMESALAASAAVPVPPEADAGYDRLKLRYASLLNRQDELRRALPAMLVSGGVFRLVDPPATPDAPVGPNKLLLAIFALGLALGLALLVAAVAEGRRVMRLQDDRDVGYFLGAPVLAAIPETLTPYESRRARSSRMLRGALFVAATVVLVPTLFALFSALRIFELLAQR
jgi:uncharacterized protein involved in exopolysaccharide biosynthesis